MSLPISLVVLFLLLLFPVQVRADFNLDFKRVKLPIPDEALVIRFGIFPYIGVEHQKASTHGRLIAELTYVLPGDSREYPLIYSAQDDTTETIIDLGAYFDVLKPSNYVYSNYIPYGDDVLILLSGQEGVFFWQTDGTKKGTKLLFSTRSDIDQYFEGSLIGGTAILDLNRVLNFGAIFNGKFLLTDIYGSGVPAQIFDIASRTFVQAPADSALNSIASNVDFILLSEKKSGLRTLANGLPSFVAEGSQGLGFFTTDGTVGGTKEIAANLRKMPEDNRTFPEESKLSIFLVKEQDFVSDALENQIVFITDGTTDGTRRIPKKDVVGSCFLEPTGNSRFGKVVNQHFVFIKCSPTEGRELWSINLHTRESRLLKDIFPGVTDSGILFSQNTEFGDSILFAATDPEHGTELWSTDGTVDGTYLLYDLISGPQSGVDSRVYTYLTVAPAKYPRSLVFFSSDGKIWVTNGKTSGTFSIGTIETIFGTSVNFLGITVGSPFSPIVESESLLYAARTSGSAALSVLKPEATTIPASFVIRDLGTTDSRVASNVFLAGVTDSYIYTFADYRPDLARFIFENGGGSEALNPTWGQGLVLLVTARDLCPEDDRKTDPGLCGCGVEEVAASIVEGRISSSDVPADKALCLNRRDPLLFSPLDSGSFELSNDASSQDVSAQDSVLQITFSEDLGISTAKTVIASSPSFVSRRSMLSKSRSRRLYRVKHQVRVVAIDKVSGTTRLIKSFQTRSKSPKIVVPGGLQGSEDLVVQHGVIIRSLKNGRIRINSSILSELRI